MLYVELCYPGFLLKEWCASLSRLDECSVKKFLMTSTVRVKHCIEGASEFSSRQQASVVTVSSIASALWDRNSLNLA